MNIIFINVIDVEINKFMPTIILTWNEDVITVSFFCKLPKKKKKKKNQNLILIKIVDIYIIAQSFCNK